MLMAQCAPTLKKLSLELGGSAPFIVFADADLNEAVSGLIASKYRNTGQTCICADRIFVEDSIYETFTESFAKATQELKMGDGFSPDVRLGPLINEAAVAKVEAHIHDALAKGAKLVCGGKRHRLGRTFFEPTILTEVDEKMRIAQEETFGPVTPLFRFKTEQEAVYLANATSYGLASYLFSRDVNRVFRVAEKLDFGMVSINGGLFSNEVTPFGGIKESGAGREGGRAGLDAFLEMKYMCLQGA